MSWAPEDIGGQAGPSRPRVPGPTHPGRPAMLACLPPMWQCSLSGRFSLIVLFKSNVIITWLGVTFSMFLLRGVAEFCFLFLRV